MAGSVNYCLICGNNRQIFLSKSLRKPTVDDIGSTSATIIGVNENGLGGAIICAGPALHTGIVIVNLGLVVFYRKNAVRTDCGAIAATNAKVAV